MADNGDSNGYVKFSTKELLTRIDQKVDLISDKLGSKADVAVVNALQRQLTNLEAMSLRRDGPIVADINRTLHEHSKAMEGRQRQIEDLYSLAQDVNILKVDKEKRDAIDTYKKWWISGGALGFLLIICEIVITVYQALT